MDKARWNYFISVALLISFIVVAITGLVINFAFVSGSPGEGRNIEFLGTQKIDWLPWHGYFGLLMMALALAHVLINFGFLTSMSKVIFRKKESSPEPVSKV